MDKLPFRQIHLDFHTGRYMPDVGSEFSEEDFRQALTEGHINSITLFSKCHHGWSYHETAVNRRHPTLNCNLLDRQLAVCEELGVRTQIYISAGLDERMANEHPEFLVNVRGWDNDLLDAKFHPICLNNDTYLDLLTKETEEVLQKYLGRFDGLFFDICTPPPCICSSCITSMLETGLDPADPADVQKHADLVYKKFTDRLVQTAQKYDPDLPVFFNCGNIPRNDRSVVYANTKHLELESLPTGGWGYDHFPLSASYARALGREFSGMTGKFHKTWGEFGGFKHPNALIYETSLSLAYGAKCCIGDQLHPLGCFDHATYQMIGKAYELVEQKEEYCHDVKAVSDIAIYSAYTTREDENCPDIGANRMLLEGHYLFDIIDDEVDLSAYKLVIFPDRIRFDGALREKVNRYLNGGGKILLTDKSGLDEQNRFFKEFGVQYLGENTFDHNYFVPNYDFQPNGKTAYLMYTRGNVISADASAEVLGGLQNSYFNRTVRHFCSHSTTPNNPKDFAPAVVKSGSIGYIAWDVFSQYGIHGAYHLKRMTLDLIDRLLGSGKTLETDLQSNGIVTLMVQDGQSRYVNHLLYAVTKLRGTVEVIEDAVSVYNTTVSVKIKEQPKRVYIAPEKTDIPFTYENGVLTYKVECFTLHTMVVIDV